MSDPIIQIKNMNKWFGDFQVLKDINLDVEKNKKIVVCGPSGSGKSTFIRTLNRLQPHDGGRVVVDGVEIELDLGDGITWMSQFDSEGELSMVLPSGSINLDSSFETVQHELELTMKYTAGLSVMVVQDTAEDRNVEFTRRVNSDLVIEVISVDDGAVFNQTDLKEMTAIEDDNGYKVINLKLGVTYEGTEVADGFTASASVGVSQDSEFWKIEYLNDTGDGEWTEVMDIGFGIQICCFFKI